MVTLRASIGAEPTIDRISFASAVRYCANVMDGTGTTATFTFVAKPPRRLASRARNFAGEFGPPSCEMNGASFGFSRPSCVIVALGRLASTAIHEAGTSSETPCPRTA